MTGPNKAIEGWEIERGVEGWGCSGNMKLSSNLAVIVHNVHVTFFTECTVCNCGCF